MRRLSGAQKRWSPRMENALARMAPSARSVGRGPTRNSTLTRRLELWVQVRGYGPANLVALLRLLRGELRGLDLSHVTLRGVYLQGVELQDARLSGALLRE